MDTLPGQLFIAAGAVIAALIAGAFSYFNLVSAKEAKVSEFRQEWINGLRTEISTYTSRIRAVTTLGNYIHSSPVEDKYDIDLLRERSRLYEEALAAYNSIRLRINKFEKDPAVKKINEEFLIALEMAHDCYKNGDDENNDHRLEQVIEKASPLLKHEWTRVRNGELSYRWAKHGAVILVFGAITAFIGVSYALLSSKSLVSDQKSKQNTERKI